MKQQNKKWIAGICVMVISLLLTPVASGGVTPNQPDSVPHIGPVPTEIDWASFQIQRNNNPKLDTKLNQLIDAYKLDSENWQGTVNTSGLLIENDEILLEIKFNADATSKVRAMLDSNNMRLRHHNAPGLYEAWLPIDALEKATNDPDIYFMREARLVQFTEPSVGASTSQGVAASNADVWHTAGIDGTGITIAVIDGFNNTAGQVAALQASGDWPPSARLTTVAVHGGAFGTYGNNHGLATMEIAYDMAPGATFIAYDTLTVGDWYTAIGLADAAGADIVSASLGAPLDGIGDGTAQSGSIAEAAGNARANGVLSINSAGNSREKHWNGLYNGDSTPPLPPGYADVHNWGGSTLNDSNSLCYAGPVSVNVFWDDWTAPVNHDYDVLLLQVNSAGNAWTQVASSTNLQDGAAGRTPQEWINFTPSFSSGGCPSGYAYYGVMVAKWSAASNRNLQVFTSFELTYQVNSYSLGFPGDSANVFTVAAIDVTTFAQESYSSEGPILPAGGGPSPVLGVLAGPQKPDAASFANVDTQSYGPGVFNGTSAAAPHVAGLAALVLQNNPGYNVNQLESELITIASTGDNDLGTTGHDNQYGYGRMQFKETPTAITLRLFTAQSNAPVALLAASVLGLIALGMVYIYKRRKA